MMRHLLAFTLIFVLAIAARAQTPSPHGKLDLACAACHSAEGWRPLREDPAFDHRSTGFSLVGAHAGRDCLSCHVSLTFDQVGDNCADCHTDLHRGELGQDCASCHTTDSWDQRILMVQRHQETLFPLLGVHARQPCEACHLDQQYHEFKLTPLECIGCHSQDYDQANDPNHVLAGFDRNCEVCHQVIDTDWSRANFQHPASFDLSGGHAMLDCAACHESGFVGTPTDCIACHEADFNGVADPNHVTNGFPTDCTQCHTTAAWTPVTFDHMQTLFPLTGAHLPLDCIACHESGFAGTPTDCIACHEADFNGVADPNHVTNGFPTDCTQCHTTAAWTPVTFDHMQTQFPLTGAHLPLDCIACHDTGFTGTPTDCIACHEADFNGVADPNHVTNGFPTDCTQCHTTAAWTPATFDHTQTQFPLTGAHVPLDCIACHDQGYMGTPTDCIACHESDYNNADPNHAAAMFPTDCTLCHTTVGWEPSTFDHDGLYFPIYSGRHRGEWDTCQDCHIGGNFQTFECIDCHEHNQADTDDEHDEVNGYVYESQACFSCHPDGRE